MAHEAHSAESTHDNPGILGGLLDGVAVGLGSGMAIGGLFALRGAIPVPTWFGIAGVTMLLGAIGGSIWGKNRGY